MNELLKVSNTITTTYVLRKWFLLKNWKNNDKVLQGATRNDK